MDTSAFLLEREAVVGQMHARRQLAVTRQIQGQEGGREERVSWTSLIPWKTLTGLALGLARNKLVGMFTGRKSRSWF